jgi:hypothetical protein
VRDLEGQRPTRRPWIGNRAIASWSAAAFLKRSRFDGAPINGSRSVSKARSKVGAITSTIQIEILVDDVSQGDLEATTRPYLRLARALGPSGWKSDNLE